MPRYSEPTDRTASAFVTLGSLIRPSLISATDARATAVEKLEWPSGRGNIYPSPFLFSSSSVPAFLPILLHPPFSRSLPRSFPLNRPLNPAVRSGNAPKALTVPSEMTAGCKSWRRSNTLGSDDLQGWTGRVPRVPQRGCAYGHRGCISLSAMLNEIDHSRHGLRPLCWLRYRPGVKFCRPDQSRDQNSRIETELKRLVSKPRRRSRRTLRTIGLPRLLGYSRVPNSINYSSIVLVLEYSFNSTSGRTFQFPVPPFQINKQVFEFCATKVPSPSSCDLRVASFAT